MTRINCVPVKELSTQHLVAEYRELPRIFTLVRMAQGKGRTAEEFLKQYPRYVLGVGHVSFFYPRLTYCVRRYYELVTEMKRRGYKTTYPNVDARIQGISDDWFNKWQPDQRAIDLNRSRIRERLASSQEAKVAKAAKRNGGTA